MATTKEQKRVSDGVFRLTATFTAENDAVDFNMPRVSAMSLQAESSNWGSAVLHLRGSNDGTTFYALPTATNLSANGVKSIALADLGFRVYRLIVITAAPTATITAEVVGMETR